MAEVTAPAKHGRSALKRDALGLQNAIVISVAVMSPAASIFFNTIGQAPFAGAAIPFCYLVGFVVALLVANQYSEFSRELPSSGSAYTFVSEGLGAGWGFITGWIGLIAIALGVPYSFVLFSANLATLVERYLGVSVSWSVYYVAAIGLVFAICYIGIRASLRVDLTLLAFEMGVCVVLAALVLFHVGNQGELTVAPFSPTSAPANGDLSIGIVLAILSFIGFETAAALGEETRNPRRNIPRAIYGSMIVVGAFYILMAYVATVGYGPDKIATVFAHDAAPFDTIARQLSGGGLAIVVDIAGLLSFFSAALAIVNGGARILYTLGRDGLMPPPINWAHPTRGTPAGAVAALCSLGLVAGLALGFTLTPFGAFNFLATLDALFVLLIYVLVSLACVVFFVRKRRERLSVMRHIIVPVLGLLVSGGISALALLQPGAGPLTYIPVVVGCWLAIGAVVTVVMWRRGQLALAQVSEQASPLQ